ncbi:MAG: cyanophycinase [Acidobacteriota bacterium]
MDRSHSLGSRHGVGPRGSLMLIGGNEDRARDKRVLARFVELTRQASPQIVVLTAASQCQQDMWQLYDRAFADLGVARRQALSLSSRQDADQASAAEAIDQADGIFVTGGDQRRLLSLIGGTRVDAALRRAVEDRGACIGGTSAGASAMSARMLSEIAPDKPCQADNVALSDGLGLIRHAVVDQHFAQRCRLGRLLTVVAAHPDLLGIGIDEDTALVLDPGQGLEVIGSGAVTVLDARPLASQALAPPDQVSAWLHLHLHVLPAGLRHVDPRLAPESLDDMVRILIDSEFAA